MNVSALLSPVLASGLAIPLEWVVGLGLALFAVGILGVTCRRNILIMLLSVEIMLNAANVVLVGFSRVHSPGFGYGVLDAASLMERLDV